MRDNITSFFSGFYDSVKQKEIYLKLSRKDGGSPEKALVKGYRYRLMLDIILSGKVVLTDAQFFDGLFFHQLLASEKGWQDFKCFLEKLSNSDSGSPLEIRTRGKTVTDTLNKMMGKPFVFSSLVDAEKQGEVYELMKSAINDRNEGWKDILGLVSEHAEVPDLIERFEMLEDSVKSWPACEKWGRSDIFENKLAEQVKGVKEYIENITKSNEYENIRDFVALASDEMAKAYPDRSAIEKKYRQVMKRTLSDGEYKVIDTVVERLYRAYNVAIACQHGVQCVDIGESEPEDVIDENNKIETVQCGMIDLDSISWEDFWGILNNGDSPWLKWMEYRMSPNGYKSSDVVELQEALLTYVEKEFGKGKQVELFGGGSDIYKHEISGFFSTHLCEDGSMFTEMVISDSGRKEDLNPTMIAK